MITALLTFTAVGLGFFYLQNLLFFPHVHLRLLALLVFFVGMRPSLSLALGLALTMGLLQDSYATTPLGLHLGADLVLVAAARFLRRRLLPQRLSTQVLASLVALTLQEICFKAGGFLAELQPTFDQGLILHHAGEILATAALGPLMFHLVRSLEKFLGRFGWRSTGETSGLQPLP
jgi:rod shape-determining protein MreD